jgi:uncharacterized protein
VGMRDYYLGDIRTSDPLRLAAVPDAGSFCTGCSIRGFCGGRCLYARILRPWPEEMERVVCGTVENLHRGLSGALPRVRALIGAGALRASDFAHPRYNGCEIIP